MVKEAFDTRKRFLGVPMVSSAGWVGTIKHSTMADGVKERTKALLWLNEGNCESDKNYGAQKQKTHTSHQNNLKMW